MYAVRGEKGKRTKINEESLGNFGRELKMQIFMLLMSKEYLIIPIV